jgi:hypothetical protein
VTVPAHAGGTAFIQLLPTQLYAVGAAATVAVSFVLTAAVPGRLIARLPALRVRVATVDVSGLDRLAAIPSLASLALVAALVVAGITGRRDPLDNPLPLFIWTVWWIGFTYLHAGLGDLWSVLNPWIGPWRLLARARPAAAGPHRPPLRYPAAAGAWPAVAGLALFAWFELIHPAPTDPAVLAGVVGAYLVTHLVAIVLFGPEWLARAETFSVFFRMIAGVAPLVLRPGAARGAGRARALEVTAPTLALLTAPAPSASGVVFVLLVLAAVSFDGFSRTFAWLGLLGVNPLVYPGRTALMGPNTLGLAGLFALFGLAYVAAVALGARLGRMRQPVGELARTFALALVPIVCGYHFAHYLPVFLVDVQWAVRAASDPFARGWDLLGTRDLHVVTSFLSDAGRVYAIWHAQVGLIVAAHVAGVLVAHALAARLQGGTRALVLGQLPLLALMIGYTTFGLWLLSTPAVG